MFLLFFVANIFATVVSAGWKSARSDKILTVCRTEEMEESVRHSLTYFSYLCPSAFICGYSSSLVAANGRVGAFANTV